MAKKRMAKPRAKAGGRAKARKAAPKTRKTVKARMPSQEEMMAQWQASMTPGASHARLGPLVGTWRARTTFTMQPGAPAEVSQGTSENRLVLGGRFLEQVYRAPMMGMPFEGIGFTGYDNVRKRYIGTWMDNFGTGIMTSQGAGKPTDTTIRSVGEAHDPAGKPMHFDMCLQIADRDHHTFEMWTKAPNGRRFRTMLIEYERG